VSLNTYEVKWVSKSKGFKGGEITNRTRIITTSEQSAIAFLKAAEGDDVKEILGCIKEPEVHDSSCQYCKGNSGYFNG